MTKLIELGNCDAQIQKIQTTADGGCRITLDIGHDGHALSALLMQKKLRLEDFLHIVVFQRGKNE